METPTLDTLLTGPQARLWPYSPAFFPRDTLYHLWAAIEAEAGWHRLMWWQQVPPAQQGDLATFLHCLQDKALLLVEHRDSGQQVGLIWFGDIISGVRAHISIWFKHQAWGRFAREATELATTYGHTCLSLPLIWGVTPWKAAQRHALACGYKAVATLPDYVMINKKPMPLYYTLHTEGTRHGP